jgi:hypothetical protein
MMSDDVSAQTEAWEKVLGVVVLLGHVEADRRKKLSRLSRESFGEAGAGNLSLYQLQTHCLHIYPIYTAH